MTERASSYFCDRVSFENHFLRLFIYSVHLAPNMQKFRCLSYTFVCVAITKNTFIITRMLSFNVKCAVLILAELDSACKGGKGLKTDELRRKLGYPKGLQRLLSVMKGAGFVEQDAYRGWYSLKVDLASLSLWELVSRVDPMESYWGDWPSDSGRYPGIVGFVSGMEESLKGKAADTVVSSLIYMDRKIAG